jgi:hypothetical protein
MKDWRALLTALVERDVDLKTSLYADNRKYEFENISADVIRFSAACNRVHNWATHVNDEIIKAWDSLSMDARVCVAAICIEEAESEEWE